jgi:hypothetical protein
LEEEYEEASRWPGRKPASSRCGRALGSVSCLGRESRPSAGRARGLAVEGGSLCMGKEAAWRMTLSPPQQSEVMRLNDPAETLRV